MSFRLVGMTCFGEKCLQIVIVDAAFVRLITCGAMITLLLLADG